MDYTPLTQLIAETRLADQKRHQQDVNATAWFTEATPAPRPNTRRRPNVLGRSRWRLGSAMIRLGGLIAGPACPPITSGAPYPRS